eukprot:UN02623
MVFDNTNAPREKVIGVATYFIGRSDPRAVVLTAANYSDHLLLSHGVVNSMDRLLRNDEKMVSARIRNSSRLNMDFVNEINCLKILCVSF